MGSTTIDPILRVSPEERAQIKAAKDALNREVADNWDDPVYRRAMAAAMTESVYLGFEHESLLPLMSNVEYVGFTDISYLREVKGLRAFWTARGGYIEASTLKADVLTMPRDTIGFHVSEFEDKLLTNFAETQATLVDLGIRRLDAEVNLRFLRMLQAAVPIGSPQYISGAGLSLSALNTALREVRDESRDWEVTIVGRATMTSQISDQLTGNGTFASFLPETNEDWLRRGIVGTYGGARILTLTNYRDDLDIPFFPANELWIIARDASKWAFYGGLLSKEFSEEDAWEWHYLARKDAGGIVHRPSRVRRFVDSSQLPFVIVEQ